MDADIYKIICYYDKKIKYFFSSKVKSQEDIEDLYQETIYAIMSGYGGFKKQSALSTWIYGICRNILYNYYYHKRKNCNILEKVRNQPETEDIYDRLELEFAVEKLSFSQKIIYEKYYENNLSIKQIAEQLDKNEGTVKYLLFEIRKKLKDLLS